MNEWTVFLTIGTILAFVGTMYKMFYKPTHELKIEIVKLTGELIATRKDTERQSKQLDKQGERISTNEKDIAELRLGHVSLEQRVDYIKDRVK